MSRSSLQHLPSSCLLLAVVAGLSLACRDPKDETGLDSQPPDSEPDSGQPDTGDSAPAVQPPCAGGGWGAISEFESAFHVSADLGSVEGDGSAESPLDSVEAALALAADSDKLRAVAIWPGSYSETLALGASKPGGPDYDGVALQGCSAGEVTIEAADDGESVIWVAEASDVDLAGMTLSGGLRSLWITEGATELRVQDLRVVEPLRAGVVIDGPNSVVELSDLQVQDVQPDTTDSGEELG